MKVIKDTRYIVGVAERFYKFKFILMPLLRLFFWTKPMETKHFLITDDKVIEFSEVYCQKCGATYSFHKENPEAFDHEFQHIKNTDLMHLFPDKYKKLTKTGHKHFGIPSYYPGD